MGKLREELWPWTEQPQEAVGLAAGVRAVHAAIGRDPFNIAAQVPEVIVGAVSVSTTIAGTALDPTTTSGRRIACGAPDSTDFTIVAQIVPASVTGNQQILALDSSAGTVVRRFQLRSTGSTLDLYRFNTAASFFSTSITSALAIGLPATIVAVSRGLNFALYCNDLSASASMTGAASSWDSSLAVQATWFERITGGAAADHGSHRSCLRVVLPYALDDDEARSIAHNPWQLFAPRSIWVPQAGITGGLIAGLAAEVDAAYALALSKAAAYGIAAETDSALALAFTKMLATGQASETNAALALDLSALSGVNVGQAEESDTALSPSLTKIVPAGLASEIDTALPRPLARTLPTGQAEETDTAQALALSKRLTTGRADEVDEALPVALGAFSLGIAQETDTAFALPLTSIAQARQDSGGRRRKRRNSLIGFKPPQDEATPNLVPEVEAPATPGALIVVDPMPPVPSALAPGLRDPLPPAPAATTSALAAPIAPILAAVMDAAGRAAPKPAAEPPVAPAPDVPPQPDSLSPKVEALEAAIAQRVRAFDEAIREVNELAQQLHAEHERRLDQMTSAMGDLKREQARLAKVIENQRRAMILLQELQDPV